MKEWNVEVLYTPEAETEEEALRDFLKAVEYDRMHLIEHGSTQIEYRITPA